MPKILVILECLTKWRATHKYTQLFAQKCINFQYKTVQMIILKYWNPQYEIAFADWQNVYQFPQKIKMLREVYRGELYYRMPGSCKRISYKQLKRGLQKKQIIIHEELNLLPF
mgnify:CR=1 FL=1